MHKLTSVFWIFALIGTAGLVAIVPSILRAIDGHPSNLIRSLVGFWGLTFGALGSLLWIIGVRSLVPYIVVKVIAVAVGALSGEILSAIATRNLTYQDV